MHIEKVWALYYSATGTTELAARTVAGEMAARLGVPLEAIPFTLPAQREKTYTFCKTDLVVAATPVYAGKIPNKILPDFQTKLAGNGAVAVPIVLFGNRSYDNGLAELCAVLKNSGFLLAGAGAFVARHAFTDELGTGRPDENDQAEMRAFADKIADKAAALQAAPAPLQVPGDPDAPYYVPKGMDGLPAKFLKAKPKTDPAACTACGLCARVCPMGSIDSGDFSLVSGVCIKCQACVRGCPQKAKCFDDPAFLSHVEMLKTHFRDAKKNEIFL